MSKRKSKPSVNKSMFSDILIGAMLATIVGIMPLVVRIAIRPNPPELAFLVPPIQLWDGEWLFVNIDAFAHWKGWLIIMPAIIIAFYCISSWVTSGKMPEFKTILKRAPIILACVYLFFVIISAIASSYNYTAWFGTRDREEGALMWMVYIIVFVSAMFYVREPKYAKPILWGLTFSSIVMGAIGVGQLIGFNFFDTAFASALVSFGVDGAAVSPRFDIAHGTLYNPNTFGKYTAMVAPVLLISGLTYEGKRYAKVLILLGGLLMLISVVASGSLGGVIGFAAAVTVLIFTYLCGIFNKRKNVALVGLMLGSVAVAVVLAVVFVPPINSRASILMERLRIAAAAEAVAPDRYVFEGNNMFVYRGNDRLLTLTVTSPTFEELTVAGGIQILDAAGNEITHTSRAPQTDNAPPTYTFYIPGVRTLYIARWLNLFTVQSQEQFNPFPLTIENGQIRGLRPHYPEAFDVSPPAPAWGFAGRELWGSSRGFIWSRSFPLMPSRIIIGSGPDTFVNVFPHHDIAGLQLGFNSPVQIVDKAHNLFIQTWITTGGISAIALFAIFLHYLITTFWGIVKSKGEDVALYGLRLGLLAGISGFVMSSMATDSTIGSTGVFFVLLGMGYGLNYYLKHKREAADYKTQSAA